MSKIVSYGLMLLAILFITALLVMVTTSGLSITSQPLSYPDGESESAVLYVEQCGQCHKAPLPSVHTEKEWTGVVKRMQRRMMRASVKPLNEEQFTVVLGYLQAHSKEKIN